MGPTHLFLCAAIVAVVPAAAEAQSGNILAVGIDLSLKEPTDRSSHGTAGPGFAWRLGHGGEGWGWSAGLSWYSAELQRTVGGDELSFGKLNVRPLLAGYGYSWLVGPVRLSATALGGYAFTSFKLQPTFNDAYRRMLGAETVSADIANTLVVKPGVSAWIDVGEKLGVNASAGYMIARPRVTVTSTLGADRRRVRADTFMVKVGLVYSVF